MKSLPLNFSHDFLPERSLLARILSFASKNGSGDKIEIGAETGIPTGASSGKVEPMIYYAVGMGLIHAEKEGKCWHIKLTTLGFVIKTEDPYLSEPVTLWLLHLMLCRRNSLDEPAAGVADAWFALFAGGGLRLGNSFDQKAYLHYLVDRHGLKGYLNGLSGLVLRSYLEPTCFGIIRVISTEKLDGNTQYNRLPAPNEISHYPAYTAYLFLLWDQLFCGHNQLAISEIFSESRFLSILGWDKAVAIRWLEWMADQGLIQLDRQTGGLIALRLQDTHFVIDGLFDELI